MQDAFSETNSYKGTKIVLKKSIKIKPTNQMKKYIFVILLSLLCVKGFAQKTTKNTNQNYTIGTFQGIEQGDYFYFQVKPDKAGAEMKSFMVLNTDATFEKISKSPKTYIGKKVKVYWQATMQDIPEAGGKIAIEKYIKCEILK